MSEYNTTYHLALKGDDFICLLARYRHPFSSKFEKKVHIYVTTIYYSKIWILVI